MIERIVVPQLAASVALSSAAGSSQLLVSEFLAREFIRNFTAAHWHGELSWKVIGAAIERAGKDTDALKFYELCRESRTSSRERQYAERRWVVCKLRQASREERDGHDKKAAAYRQDAMKVMEKYSWDIEVVSDSFPDLNDETAMAGATPQDFRTVAGGG